MTRLCYFVLSALIVLVACGGSRIGYYIDAHQQLIVKDEGVLDLNDLGISDQEAATVERVVLRTAKPPIIDLKRFPNAEGLAFTQPENSIQILNGGRIRSLVLIGGKIADISTVRGLPNLEFLSLGDTSVTNLDGLEATKIRVISMNGNMALTDFSALAGSNVQILELWEPDFPQVIANLEKLYPVNKTGDGRYTVDAGGRTIKLIVRMPDVE